MTQEKWKGKEITISSTIKGPKRKNNKIKGGKS
jgi:hypothetical protein